MLPAQPVDALLILSRKEPKVGDIIHVKSQVHNYAHRLIAIDDKAIVTKGDNSPATEVAAVNDVMGMVVFSVSFKPFLFLILSIIVVEGFLAVAWIRRLLLYPRKIT